MPADDKGFTNACRLNNDAPEFLTFPGTGADSRRQVPVDSGATAPARRRPGEKQEREGTQSGGIYMRPGRFDPIGEKLQDTHQSYMGVLNLRFLFFPACINMAL